MKLKTYIIGVGLVGGAVALELLAAPYPFRSKGGAGPRGLGPFSRNVYEIFPLRLLP